MLLIRPGQISGTLSVPGDKSLSHRAAMLAALAEGRSTIVGFLRSADCLATLAALSALGVAHRWSGDRLSVDGVGLTGLKPAPGPIDCGNSGTTMRLLCGLLAAQSFASELVGDVSLMRRPMKRVAEPLRRLGACIDTLDGHAPVSISAVESLRAADSHLGIASAQVKTALMFAALFADGTSAISAPGRIRDHSERLFPWFGAACESKDGVTRIDGRARLRPAELTIPGDFSSAAFLIVAGLIAGTGEIRIDGVGLNPTRTALIDVLRSMGAKIEVVPAQGSGPEPRGSISVRPSSLTGVEVPPDVVPAIIDEFPALCIAASCAEGATTVSGASELRIKESDRIETMAAALTTLGIQCETRSDGMTIVGGGVRGGSVCSGGDHRIAMALAVLGLVADNAVTVSQTACIATSFPGFAAGLRGLGATIEQGQNG